MNSSSATIPEDTFRGGASEVYVSVYRVTQNGLNIQTIAKLLPTLAIGSTVSSHTGSGSTVTNTIAAGKNLDEVTQTLLNNDYKINSDLTKNYAVDTTHKVNINSYTTAANAYTCPSDGYVSVTSTGTAGLLYAVGNDASNILLCRPMASGGTNGSDSAFVRKGMKVFASGLLTAEFTPLI